MSNLQDPSVSLGCIDQGLTVLHARGDRFLHQNVYPVLKKLHANPGVIGRRRGQADSIYLAEYLAKNYVESITAFAKMVRPDPLVHAWVAAAYAQLGRTDEARAMAGQFLQRVSELPWTPKGDNPLEWRKYWDTEFRSRDLAARRHLFNGLGKAGLPSEI